MLNKNTPGVLNPLSCEVNFSLLKIEVLSVKIAKLEITWSLKNHMLNKNTPGVKKARPSRKHQLALIHTLN